eukprot:2677579-Amphidinium_carterae.1
MARALWKQDLHNRIRRKAGPRREGQPRCHGKYSATVFYARVPSKSNPADGASRDGVAEVAR